MNSHGSENGWCEDGSNWNVDSRGNPSESTYDEETGCYTESRWDGSVETRCESYDEATGCNVTTYSDGRQDAWIELDPKTGKATRTETDTSGDGKRDTWQVSSAKGVIQSQASDRNADGVADRTIFFEKGAAARYEQDDDFDGRIDARGTLDAEGEPRVSETDTTGDGLFDSRITHEAGQKVLELSLIHI